MPSYVLAFHKNLRVFNGMEFIILINAPVGRFEFGAALFGFYGASQCKTPLYIYRFRWWWLPVTMLVERGK